MRFTFHPQRHRPTQGLQSAKATPKRESKRVNNKKTNQDRRYGRRSNTQHNGPIVGLFHGNKRERGGGKGVVTLFCRISPGCGLVRRPPLSKVLSREKNTNRFVKRTDERKEKKATKSYRGAGGEVGRVRSRCLLDLACGLDSWSLGVRGDVWLCSQLPSGITNFQPFLPKSSRDPKKQTKIGDQTNMHCMHNTTWLNPRPSALSPIGTYLPVPHTRAPKGDRKVLWGGRYLGYLFVSDGSEDLIGW